MTGTCRLNNKNLRNYRRTPEYQAVMVDLALLGIVSKEECEMILGSGIPAGLVLPDGSSALISEKELPESEFVETDETPESDESDESESSEEPEAPESDESEETSESEGSETPEVTDDEGRTESDN